MQPPPEGVNDHGWFWGVGFTGSPVDTMHFELADETIKALVDASLAPNQLMAAEEYIKAMGTTASFGTVDHRIRPARIAQTASSLKTPSVSATQRCAV